MMNVWKAAIGTAIGIGISTGAFAAPVGYSLGNNGRTVVTMPDLANTTSLSGASIKNGVTLNALAYRPTTTQLYGYSNVNNTVYLVNPMNGDVSPVASTVDGTNVAEVGFDFNNQIDAARIVSTAEDNLVFFPNNSPPNIARFTNLFYGAGDVNAGQNPSIFANAYTNAVPNASSTQQFVLDGEWDVLATLANNAGTLTTVGEVISGGSPLDFTNTGGLDILSFAEGDNTAYALLTTVTGTGLYGIDLVADTNGKVNANLIGMVGTNFGVLDGLAVAPDPVDTSAVPVPPSVLLMGGAIAGMAILRRRQKQA